MDILFTSALVVALAEMGDKTQLLAIVLATRFRRPWPIIAGILVATLANHALAALAGASIASLLDGAWFRYCVAASFIFMAAWTLVPDKADDLNSGTDRFGPFIATTIAFFLVEIGDKTQVATIALGARFQSVTLVTAGTTLGMMAANVPAVFLGHALIKRVPIRALQIGAAALFLMLGLWLAVNIAQPDWFRAVYPVR